MRLLTFKSNGEVTLTKNFIKDIPPYAILSHTWGDDDEEEVSFQNMLQGSGKKKPGYKKIRFCGVQAACDGLQHFWVDTCCINKTNNTELSEAINSMFNWYQDAVICYAYLSDVDIFSDLDSSRWFQRGWTLQELLAPRRIAFFNSKCQKLGSRSTLSPTIFRITGIPCRVLVHNFSGEFSVAQVMSWAAGRETTREEDIAYCLLGLLGVNMPLIYGEGRRAFGRLQQEYMKTSADHTLFSWRGSGEERGPLAQSPTEFSDCKDFTAGKVHSLDFSDTNRGLRIDLPLIKLEDGNFAAVLDCYGRDGLRRAIYLKEVRPDVYRRIRCTEELHRIYPGDVIPAPKTVYIEPAVSRTLGRDRLIPKNKWYSFQVDFRAVLPNGFCPGQHHSPPDDRVQWNLTDSKEGFSVLTLDGTGLYGGLQFNSASSEVHFVVIIGIHNQKAWLDITSIGLDETFEGVVEEYYHYSKAHDNNNLGCRCHRPWDFLNHMAKPLSCGMSVDTSINSNGSKRRFKVIIQVKVDE